VSERYRSLLTRRPTHRNFAAALRATHALHRRCDVVDARKTCTDSGSIRKTKQGEFDMRNKHVR